MKKHLKVYHLRPWGTKNSVEECKNSPPREVVTALELVTKID